ncbi:asparagine synthase (glutamine-hydrolyzing) [Amycolatopsis anabasis]|uniref:asparagine synthase (glutamine-hydrolyzing) n=1 Tax=Amycolatopsis anabasis TaxID=1840409 RepID=UPI00131E099C|nr:asparagine synthase (glutamine-hydrolyzing) [Amycolatopsis anabasis]
MCGITGWIAYRRDLTTEEQTVDAMTETMARRGPDAAGTWISPTAALGHRRLSVIDPPGGAQPMELRLPSGAIVLTYSGETYNFTELRDELRRRGHRFATASDTEVVLHAYLEWGDELVDHLNGMYAFAIWDGRTDRLLLVRDRLGVKPLFYFPTDDGVLFGSEPRAILANPLAEPVVDAEHVSQFLVRDKTPGRASWAGMHEVLPGALVVADRAGCRERVYWKLEARPHTDDLPSTVARVRELLDDVIERQLVADVPLCSLLSGGLDSSAVTGIAARRLAGREARLRSFAVDFAGQTARFVPNQTWGSPDTPYAHQVAAFAGTDHSDIVLDYSAMADPEVRRTVVTARGVPGGFSDMDLSLFLLSQAVREQSTVALSGESADELFGGYPWCHDGRAAQPTFPWMASPPGQAAKPPVPLTPEMSALLDLPAFNRTNYEQAMAQAPVLEGESAEQRRMREVDYLNLTRHLGLLLDRKDRMTMATGLEVRVPFCDHRLVQYVFNAPWAMKAFDGREKSLLRAATADVLPDAVARRKKSPFPATQDVKYVMAVQQQLGQLLGEGDHRVFDFFDRAWARRVAAAEPGAITGPTRKHLEYLLDFVTWMEVYRPRLRLA